MKSLVTGFDLRPRRVRPIERMKTVLLAWELGAGLGHVAGLRRVARELAAHGHRPVFALRDVVGPQPVLKNEGFAVLQAPIWPKPQRRPPFRAASYADILAIHGFANADGLSLMVAAWQNLFDRVKPDLIVADHSPTACLAAYGALPAALLGNGFTLPPADLPEFPPMRPEVPRIVPEHRVLKVVEEVQRRRKRPAPETLPRLLDSPVRSVCTFPELDPYAGVRREPVVGPLEPLPAPAPFPKEPGLHAYCAAEFRAIEDVTLCLADLDAAVQVYIHGSAGPRARSLEGCGITVHKTPPPLTEVLPKVSAVLSHANLGTAHAALAAGRPQLVLPRHLEQNLTAQALESLGVAVRLCEGVNRESLRKALKRVLNEPKFRDRATAWANTLRERDSIDALSKTVAGCLELIS